MTYRRPAVARLVCVLAVALAFVLATESMAVGQSLREIRGQLERAREEYQRLEQRMEETQLRLEELHARQDELERERDALSREFQRAEAEIHEVSARVNMRVRETFKHGSSLDPVAVFLSSDDAFGALARAETVRWLVAGDRSRVDELAAARVRSAAARELLDDRTRQLEATSEQFAELEASLSEDLAAVQSLVSQLNARERAELERLERERRERERREREAAERRAREAAATAAPATPTSSGGLVCPIGRPRSFIDSWGHPRSGGRRHRGTDLMSPHGTPILAVTDGVWVHRRPGASAGIWGVLQGTNGDHYWYLHLSSHTVGSGTRVSAGQQVGTNGSTGNATTPHLHFELHPGGGGAVNPYPLLRRIC